MLTTSTIGGVIIQKTSGWITLLLKTGKKEKIKVIETDLEVGDKVAVAFNCHTSTIVNIYSELDMIQGEKVYMPNKPKPNYPLEDKYYDT